MLIMLISKFRFSSGVNSVNDFWGNDSNTTPSPSPDPCHVRFAPQRINSIINSSGVDMSMMLMILGEMTAT
eukprot:511239-Amphidinium_carterae.1